MKLTEETRARLEFLFSPALWNEATALLERECSNNLPFLDKATPTQLQRYHFAALKLSGGNLEELRRAVAVAKVDWRDLIVAAGFGHSCEAHLLWQPHKQGQPPSKGNC